jgi:hypothetical protein
MWYNFYCIAIIFLPCVKQNNYDSVRKKKDFLYFLILLDNQYVIVNFAV